MSLRSLKSKLADIVRDGRRTLESSIVRAEALGLVGHRATIRSLLAGRKSPEARRTAALRAAATRAARPASA